MKTAVAIQRKLLELTFTLVMSSNWIRTEKQDYSGINK